MKNPPKLRPLAAALTALFAAPDMLHAQTAKETTAPQIEVISSPLQEDFRTESTQGATRTETPLRDIPQYINVVPQAVIQSQGARTLQDALRNVPGITYAAPEGGTQANQIFYIRGFPSGGDLFIDGVRDIGEYNRDLFATQSVEVLKGPSALIFGRGSTGGVINQVTKRPEPGGLKEVGLSLGTFGEKRVTGDLNLQMSDTSALRLIALGEDSDSSRDTVEVKKVGFAPSVRFGIGTPTEVELSYYFLKTSDVTDYGQPTLGPTFNFRMPPVSMEKYYGFANYDHTDHETHIATFRVDHKFNDALSLRNTLRYAYYRRDMEATIATLATTDVNGKAVTTATPFEQLLVNRQHNKSRDNGDHALINQTDLTWKLETGAIKHTVLTGLELSQESLHRLNYNFDANPGLAGVQAPAATTLLLDPDPFTSLSYTKTPNQRSEAEARTVAVLVQDQLEFTPQWKALLGLRWERYDSEAKVTDAATGVPTATGGPFSRVDKMVSGRAGLIFQPTATQSYYVSYGNSYNPSGELGVYGATGTNLSAINEDLDPEENINAEVGAQWDLASGFQLRTAIFRNEKINQRMVDPTGVTVLEGKRRVDGLEVSAAGQITPNWMIYAAAAFMEGEIVEAAPATQGKKPWGVPYLSGSVWTIYRLGGGWEVGGGAFGSSYYWLDDQNRGEVPGYVRWDATVAYIQKKYDVRLNFFNVFDKTYYIGGYQNNPNRVLPGTPRSAMLTFTYRFD
jgi:catecholate siderophore receptor